jgi:formamidopyrimidine-DNA glycosylase
MPELPDIELYLEALRARILDRPVRKVRVRSPFVVRSVEPPVQAIEGKRVTQLRRIGKRLVLSADDDVHVVIHLMIAGRLRWKARDAAIPKKRGLAAFDFADGTVLLTEASTQQRASIRLVRGEERLARLDPGGLDVFGADLEHFRAAITRENHTLKRTLTDPRILSGIGNAYSDEILHAARLSPLALTSQLEDAEIEQLFTAARNTLAHWTERLRTEAGDKFPDKVTAFREGMAVHGRYRSPCPDCGSPIQRIRYAQNEVNYCAGCQTGGRVLADRAMSRLLKSDWPRSLDDWEHRMGRGGTSD